MDSGRGWRLAKEKASRKIDGLVALSFACLSAIATSAPPAGGYVDPGQGDENIYGATRERPDRPRGFGLGSVDRSRRERIQRITTR